MPKANKVLFVDDDRSLLNSLERNLCFEFQLTAAEGGAKALEVGRQAGPFSVVVVDMRMPDMDGIEVIKALREMDANLVFIMLTGNQDTPTAIQAVNTGRVFKFLTKPCNMDEIRESLRDAQAQYEARFQDKDLMLDAMLGSINVLTDVAELYSDRLLKPMEVNDVLMELAESLEISVTTEDRVAARVLLVGLASLTDEERTRMSLAKLESDEYSELFHKLCQQSAKMVARVPRFEGIAEFLKCVPAADTLDRSAPASELKATLLRIAFFWGLMRRRGRDRQSIFEVLQIVVPSITVELWRLICR